MLHCWKGRAEHIEELHGFHSMEHLQAAYLDMSATCMLEREHSGEHDFTPDDQITFTVAEVR
jgi:hypothetical protein